MMAQTLCFIKIKNIMKKLLLAALISLSVSILPQNLKSQTTKENSYVEVTATAFNEVAPNEFFIQIIIDETLSGSKATLEKKERELYSALKELGIDIEKNMQVQDLTSSLKNSILRQAKILNRKSFILKVDSPELIFGVFNATEKLKISQVSITKTAVSDPEKIKSEVLAKAAAKAKSNAEVLASSLGFKLGKPIYVQNYDNALNPFRMLAKSSISIRGAATDTMNEESAPELEFEKIRFEQQVVIRFSIE